jgi:general secretion pathway protein D
LLIAGMLNTKIVLVATAVLLASCSMVGPIDTSLGATKPLVMPVRAASQAPDIFAADKAATTTQAAQNTQFFKVPVTPSVAAAPVQAPTPPVAAPNANDETISAVTLDGIPLPQFINTIYATVLKRNVSVDPAIQTRTDLVSLRTGKPQTAAQLSAAAQSVLKSYGVSINEFEGLVRCAAVRNPMCQVPCVLFFTCWSWTTPAKPMQ